MLPLSCYDTANASIHDEVSCHTSRHHRTVCYPPRRDVTSIRVPSRVRRCDTNSWLTVCWLLAGDRLHSHGLKHPRGLPVGALRPTTPSSAVSSPYGGSFGRPLSPATTSPLVSGSPAGQYGSIKPALSGLSKLSSVVQVGDGSPLAHAG